MLLNTVQGRDLCLRCIKIPAFFILPNCSALLSDANRYFESNPLGEEAG